MDLKEIEIGLIVTGYQLLDPSRYVPDNRLLPAWYPAVPDDSAESLDQCEGGSESEDCQSSIEQSWPQRGRRQ